MFRKARGRGLHQEQALAHQCVGLEALQIRQRERFCWCVKRGDQGGGRLGGKELKRDYKL